MNAQILILDDDPQYAEMLAELLEVHGFIAEVCHDPYEALDRLRTGAFDLVMSDFKMPGLDGGSVLQTIRKEQPHLPVVIISGLMNPRDLIKVANLNVNLVLEKPFNVHDLVDYVRRYVKPQHLPSQDPLQASLVGASYPRPCRQIYDASWPTQVAMQSLWEALQHGPVLPIVSSDHYEVELVAQQVAEWKLGADFRIRLLDPANLSEPFAAGLFTASNAAEAQQVAEALQQFLPTLTPPAAVVVVALAPGLENLWEDACRGWTQPNPPLVWPRLAQRVLDVAKYAEAALRQSPGDPMVLEPEAGAWVLTYRWPGGLRELRAVMRRAAAYATPGAPLPLFALLQAARAAEAGEELLVPDGSLATFLRREQAGIVRQSVSPSALNDPFTAAQEVAVPAERVAPRTPLEDQPLWFPELLRAPWHEEV